MQATTNQYCLVNQILSKGAELPRQPPTHPEETEEELTETAEMLEEGRGEGPELGREPRLQKDGSGESSPPPSERLLPLKGESTESDLEEEDDEDEAIELKECDEDGTPYGQVGRTAPHFSLWSLWSLVLCRDSCIGIDLKRRAVKDSVHDPVLIYFEGMSLVVSQ